MRISVAMCTYNGARFLAEQLQSIAGQSRLPDELVVCDDCSTDETPLILQRFVVDAPFAVRVLANTQQLGAVKNFEQAMQHCTGDVIALSDQDDLWHSSKLARFQEIFSSRPRTALVFTDAELIDDSGQLLGQRLWPAIDFEVSRQKMFTSGRAFDALLRGNVATGATMAFRSSYTALVLPIPQNIPVLHDAWIATLIAAVADVVGLPEPLTLYRQHAQQHTRERDGAIQMIKSPAHYESHLHWLQEMQQRIRDFRNDATDVPNKARSLRIIQANAAHIRARLSLPQQRWRRLLPVLSNLMTGAYRQYSNGWRSAARDLLF